MVGSPNQWYRYSSAVVSFPPGPSRPFCVFMYCLPATSTSPMRRIGVELPYEPSVDGKIASISPAARWLFVFDGLFRESPITPTAPPLAVSTSCSAKFADGSSNFPLAQLMLNTTGSSEPFVRLEMLLVCTSGLFQPLGEPWSRCRIRNRPAFQSFTTSVAVPFQAKPFAFKSADGRAVPS